MLHIILYHIKCNKLIILCLKLSIIDLEFKLNTLFINSILDLYSIYYLYTLFINSKVTLVITIDIYIYMYLKKMQHGTQLDLMI